jgi:hypothetical protein
MDRRLLADYIQDGFAAGLALVFSLLFGWVQWRAALAHVCTVPAYLLLVAFRDQRAAVLCSLLLSLTVAAADVWSACMFVCQLGRCCPPGERVSALSAGARICDDARRLDLRPLSLTGLFFALAQAAGGARVVAQVWGAHAQERLLVDGASAFYVGLKCLSLLARGPFSAGYYAQAGLATAAAVFATGAFRAHRPAARGALGLAALSDAALVACGLLGDYPLRAADTGSAAGASVAVWHLGACGLATATVLASRKL